MIEIHFPKEYSYNARVGVWDTTYTGVLDKSNEIFLGVLAGKKVMKSPITKGVLRIRQKGFLPISVDIFEGVCQVVTPVSDSIRNNRKHLQVAGGRLEWVWY